MLVWVRGGLTPSLELQGPHYLPTPQKVVFNSGPWVLSKGHKPQGDS